MPSQPAISSFPFAEPNAGPRIISRDIIDLRVPKRAQRARQTGGLLPMLEGWVLRKAEAGGGLPGRSWCRITRILLPISFEELQSVVHAYGQNGKRFWDEFASLSNYQQRQIDRLLEDKRSDDTDQRYEWVLAAVKTDPPGAKKMDIITLQIIVQRRLRVGALPLAAHHPQTDAVSTSRKVRFSHSRDDSNEEDSDTNRQQPSPPKPPPDDSSPSSKGERPPDLFASTQVSATPAPGAIYTPSYPLGFTPIPNTSMTMAGAPPRQNTYAPSISPYISLGRKGQAPKGSEKQIPKILEWIVPSMKRGRNPTNVSRLTSQWNNAENDPTAFRDESDRGSILHRAHGVLSAQPFDDSIVPLPYAHIPDYALRQQGDYRLPPNAYQSWYPQWSNTRFEGENPYGDKVEPLRLPSAPEQPAAVPSMDDRASDLALGLYDPIFHKRRGHGRQHPAQDGGMDTLDSAIPAIEETRHSREPMSLHYDGTYPSRTAYLQRLDPLQESLISKYTVLDENYPTDGESIQIAREDNGTPEPEDQIPAPRHDGQRGSGRNSDKNGDIVI
jgi:hypothetical protein